MARSCKYKYCMVPKCNSSSFSMSKKLFIHVPKGEIIRKQWCLAMNRKEVSAKSTLYVCEDHFDLEKDMANFMRYQFQGGKIILKPGVIPHKFDCQKAPVAPKHTSAGTSPKKGEKKQRKRLCTTALQANASTSAEAAMADTADGRKESTPVKSVSLEPEVVIKQEIIDIEEESPNVSPIDLLNDNLEQPVIIKQENRVNSSSTLSESSQNTTELPSIARNSDPDPCCSKSRSFTESFLWSLFGNSNNSDDESSPMITTPAASEIRNETKYSSCLVSPTFLTRNAIDPSSSFLTPAIAETRNATKYSSCLIGPTTFLTRNAAEPSSSLLTPVFAETRNATEPSSSLLTPGISKMRNVSKPSSSLITSTASDRTQDKDQFEIYGQYIAAKLRKLDRITCAYAQKAIGDIIFDAEMGHLTK